MIWNISIYCIEVYMVMEVSDAVFEVFHAVRDVDTHS